MPSGPLRAVIRDSEPSLGERLRAARSAQRRTLADIASASGLTKGFLSKLENDQGNASVASLVRLCEALEIPVGSLFEPPTGAVVRHDAYPQIAFGGEGMREFVLTPRGEKRLQVLLSEIEPGGGSGPDHYILPTDVEFVFVVSGTLEVDLAGNIVTLDAGDALTFSGTTKHHFRAVGPDVVRVLWVVSPALPHEGTRRAGSASQEVR
jgi:transcriptional regulator with XRE-family HTH domain